MKIFEFAKDHPYMTAGGVFVGGLILIIIMSSGTSSEEVEPSLGGFSPYDNSAAIAANSVLAQNQLAAQVASRVSDNERLVAESDNETAYKISKANFEFQNNANVITAQVATANIAAQTEQARLTSETTLGLKRFETEAATTIGLAGFERDRYIAQKSSELESMKYQTEADVAKYLSDNVYRASVSANEYAYNALLSSNDLARHKSDNDYRSTVSTHNLQRYLSDNVLAGVRDTNASNQAISAGGYKNALDLANAGYDFQRWSVTANNDQERWKIQNTPVPATPAPAPTPKGASENVIQWIIANVPGIGQGRNFGGPEDRGRAVSYYQANWQNLDSFL